MKNRHILISDPSLRDGNHAVSHQITKEQIAGYCKRADDTKIPIVEVGHGNGLGASSLLLGKSCISDEEMLITARENLQFSKLSIHSIAGFATIKRDLSLAINCGVDIIRVASHCSEANITQRHINFVREQGKTAYGILMMSHMLNPHDLAEQAKKMESYGAQAIVFMDSAGNMLPNDVKERVLKMKEQLSIPIGFHGHNNLSMGVANAISAIEAGASILDASIRGFGAGSGNVQLEVLVAVLHRLNYLTDINLYKVLDLAEWATNNLMKEIPVISSTSIVSGLSGVFSGFLKPVQRIAKEYNIDPRDLFFELGKRNIIAGQEDLILKIAVELANKK